LYAAVDDLTDKLDRHIATKTKAQDHHHIAAKRQLSDVELLESLAPSA
jgi:ribosome-associated translation inhibitor RaiA